MRHRNGFTLVEVLFVLAILSVLLVISAPLQMSVLDKKTGDSFLDTFQMDLLYLQSLSYNSKTNYRLFLIDSEHYAIKKTETNIIERKVPEGWTMAKQTLKTISFTKNGIIREPGTLFVGSPKDKYNLICPLGKGRCYFEKL